MKPFTELTDSERRFIVSVGSKTGGEKKVLEFALAKLLACKYAIPSSPVAEIQGYYQEQVINAVFADLNTIVEFISIDFQYVVEVVRKFWMIRYRNLFPGIIFPETNQGIRLVFGIAEFFSKEECDFIANNSTQLVMLYNQLFEIFNK